MAMTPSILLTFMVVLVAFAHGCRGMVPPSTMKVLRKINRHGPYVGLVVPNSFEMGPLLQSPSFVAGGGGGGGGALPTFLDVGGKRFRFGSIGKKKVIVVMTGLSMVNAGVTTQLLLSFFRVEGVVHFGVAGNADSKLEIGDVTIPREWAHLGLWNWQRYGDGPKDPLALEESGDYTRKIGSLHFSDYDSGGGRDKNLLNSVWYQPEEIFPVGGMPEMRQRALWVPVDEGYLALSLKLQGMKLERCVNATTCLPRSPAVVQVERGSSANIFVDNAAYRAFLRSRFNVTAIDMETAAVALVSLQQSTPFIALRSLSDLAGGGSAQSNEASVFVTLAALNVVSAVVKFVSLLP